MTALLGWQGPVRADEARAEEYRELAADLATEILATLDGSASRRPPHDKH